MIIINADDWGCTPQETDAALSCFAKGRITSVTAMVFMEDSVRAAALAREAGIDVGLHLNLSRQFADAACTKTLRACHNRVRRYITSNKYAGVIYNPVLRGLFRTVYEAQAEEFVRLYGKPPSHIDGHHHLHLCANIALDTITPEGTAVRRNFHFWPVEKGFVNRTYRQFIDQRLGRRYRLTDYFFSLSQSLANGNLPRIADLAASSSVELMTHPVNEHEFRYLMSDAHLAMLGRLEQGTYASLEAVHG